MYTRCPHPLQYTVSKSSVGDTRMGHARVGPTYAFTHTHTKPCRVAAGVQQVLGEAAVSLNEANSTAFSAEATIAQKRNDADSAVTVSRETKTRATAALDAARLAEETVQRLLVSVTSCVVKCCHERVTCCYMSCVVTCHHVSLRVV